MLLQQLQRLIVLPASAILLVAGGCHLCPLGQSGQNQQAASNCQAEQLACKTPPNGYVNENEKDPKKARKNAKKDAKINADGCSPQCERIPLLKRIADKENLASDIPVIKAAAKIKHEEEMCQQKVKAVKYLGTIGCCCYDKDGEVAKALLEALNDCLPAVRLAAVQAIGGCVCGQAYSRSCCNDDIAERLEEMAYKNDDNGCPIEPEPQIRQWAAYVAPNCQKKRKKEDEKKTGPSPIEGGKEDEENDKEMKKEGEKDSEKEANQIPPGPLPLQTRIETAEPMDSDAGVSYVEQLISSPMSISFHQPYLFFARSHHEAVCETVATVAVPDADVIVDDSDETFQAESVAAAPASLPASENIVTSTLFHQTVGVRQRFPMNTVGLVSANQIESEDPFESNQTPRTRPVAEQTTIVEKATTAPLTTLPVESVPVVSQPVVFQPAISQPATLQQTTTSANRIAMQSSRRVNVQGRIESVDIENEVAVIRFAESVSPGVSSRVHVVHKYALGRVQAIGEFEVLQPGTGIATIRPVAGTSMRKISVGDMATVYCE